MKVLARRMAQDHRDAQQPQGLARHWMPPKDMPMHAAASGDGARP